MGEFTIVENDQKRRYRGKIFFFEKCTVYTEIIEENYLEYRGYYMHTRFGMIYKEGKSKFKLFELRSGHKEIELYNDIVTVNEWALLIQEVLMIFVEQGE